MSYRYIILIILISLTASSKLFGCGSSITSRGKLQLAALYSVQTEYKKDYGRFTTEINKAGYEIPDLNYCSVGFFHKNGLSIFHPKKIKNSERKQIAKEELNSTIYQLANEFCPDCIVTNNSFKLFSVCNITNDPNSSYFLTLDIHKKFKTVKKGYNTKRRIYQTKVRIQIIILYISFMFLNLAICIKLSSNKKTHKYIKYIFTVVASIISMSVGLLFFSVLAFRGSSLPCNTEHLFTLTLLLYPLVLFTILELYFKFIKKS